VPLTVPRHLSAALDKLVRGPGRDDGVYGDAAAVPDEQLANYLGWVSVAQLVGLSVDEVDVRKLETIWRSRPDLRSVLGPLIENLVFDVLLRPFLRWHVATSRGDVERWVASYPTLVPALTAHHQRQLRRFNDAETVICSATILVRHLGASRETWRAAALALKRRERVDRKRPFSFDDLRHDLEDHGVLSAAEAAVLNEYLASIDAEPLEHIAGSRRWHPKPRSRARLLGLLARASRAWCPSQWDDLDIALYASALSQLPTTELTDFADVVAGDRFLLSIPDRVLRLKDQLGAAGS
jgi:hypothetical protein